MGILEKDVLILNRHWIPVNVVPVRSVLPMMASGAVTGLDFSDDGHFLQISWDRWLALPVRNQDDFIRTPSRCVRAPRVVVARKFDKTVLRRPRLSLRTLRERDGDLCAYTLRKLQPHECSVEHVVPRSHGGHTTWENVVLADKAINHRRGNKDLQAAGLELKRKPFRPKPRPFATSVRNRSSFPEWRFFLGESTEG